MTKTDKTLTPDQQSALINTLKQRFEHNMPRHKNLVWTDIQTRLETTPSKLWSLNEMENTKGEPDVIDYDPTTNEYIFYDCSPESPLGRRSLCYDRAALESRKANKPQSSAQAMAETMGIKLLNETEYRHLQQFGIYDLKSSSWIETPTTIRKQGGALFANYHYDQIFIYYNGADAYYASRGFRGSLRV